jgi:ribosomal-protein-alanine acetyltransferase
MDPPMNNDPASNLGNYRGVVRAFEVCDAAAVEEILRKSPEAAVWTLNSLERLRLRGEIAWVIEIEGAISGFVVARTVGYEAEILNLSVDPAKRRAGYATALLHAALAEFQRLRIKTAFLEVRESNLSAISFYVKHGFVQNGSRPAYYQSPTEAAVLMKRELTG